MVYNHTYRQNTDTNKIKMKTKYAGSIFICRNNELMKKTIYLKRGRGLHGRGGKKEMERGNNVVIFQSIQLPQRGKHTLKIENQCLEEFEKQIELSLISTI